MNQQPDKLFREKLEGYHKPAPAGAWEKIASAQSKKNNKGLWLKIAASLSLIAIAAYLLWPGRGTIEQRQPVLTDASKERPDNITALQPTQEQNPTVEKDVQQEPIARTVKPSSRKGTSKRTPVNATQIEEVTIPQETNPVVTESIPRGEQMNTVAPIAGSSDSVIAEPAVKPAPTTQNITLVFTAEEVNEYLDKKALAQATSDEKKSSTLKKLLKKANELKNNQDPFGELRQKKNEILALNFKNERQRGQNK